MQGSTCNSSATNAKYWAQEPTLILVVWDDWGGWFDHVEPFVARIDLTNPPKGYTPCDPSKGQWGCGFTEGFRVPLLVVSPYTLPGYVSGACTGTTCNNDQFPSQHDFGSILAFTEYNFGMQFIDGPPDDGYADYNAPDWSPDHTTHVPLSDFFGSSTYNFTSISIPARYQYPCFQHFANCVPGWVPTAPDND